MASRFPDTVKRAGGGMNASQRRMSASTTKLGSTGNSVVRSGSSGLIRRHSINTPEGSGSRSEVTTLKQGLMRSNRTVGDWPEDAPAAGYCHLCGDELTDTGKGLTVCKGCHILRLKSGRTSHVASKATREASSDGSKSKDPFAVEPGTSADPVAMRGAWRRMSMRKDGVLDDDVISSEGPKKIMAGFIDTGFKVGDRIKSRFRPAPEKAEERGWNPLNKATDEGDVIGQGHKVGEVLVKFDYGDVTASMKLHQIEKIDAQAPVGNVDRMINRRMSSKGIARASTLEK